MDREFALRRRARRRAGKRERRALAPGRWFKTVSKEEYRKLYLAEVLAPLDPRETYDALCALAGEAAQALLDDKVRAPGAGRLLPAQGHREGKRAPLS